MILSEQKYLEALELMKKAIQILQDAKQETKEIDYPKADSKYCVFVDAGHGAINPNTNKYECLVGGKQFTHKGTNDFHFGGDTYFEGVGNRILAEKLIQRFKKAGINYHKTYHDYLDYGLNQRASIANTHHKNIQKGFGESIHSNASEKNNASGWCVFTSPKQTESDKLATFLWERTKAKIAQSYGVLMREDKWSDGDVDLEAKFTILTATNMPFILSENMFFDFWKDGKLLMDDTFQNKLVDAKFEAAVWGQDNLLI